MHHVKIATVRDLRYAFARVSRWIEDGESVRITRRGRTFATLAPVKSTHPPLKDWPDFAARRAKVFPKGVIGQPLSEIVDEGRGDR